MAGQAGAIRAGRAYVELFADNSRFVAGLRAAESQLRAFGSKIQGIGAAMAAFGSAALAPFAVSTGIYKGFEDVMLAVQATSGATAEEYERLTEKAKSLGMTTSFTAQQVASGMLNLARAGFSVKEIDNSIDSILNLARATGTDLSEATDIAASTLRSFGMEASEMQRIADVLTATANRSAQTLSDLGEAMKYAAPTALDFGLTVEDVAKALGTLANFGIKGSMAGTAFRNIMLRMSDPKIIKKLKELGVVVKDSSGGFRNLADIMRDLGAATKDMGDVERLSILNELFGVRAIGAGAKLTTAQFDELIEAIDNAAGTAAKTAKVMDSGLGGALRRMFSAFEGIAVAIGRAISKPLSIAADVIAAISKRIIELVDEHRVLVAVSGAAAAAIVATGMALVGLGIAFKVAAFALGTVRVLITALLLPFKALSVVFAMLASPIGLTVAALGGLTGALLYTSGAGGKAISFLSSKFSDLKSAAIEAWEGIAAAYAKGDLGLAMRIAWLTIKMEFEEGINEIRKKWVDFRFWFAEIAYDAFYGALAAWEIVQHGIVVGMIEAAAAATNAWDTFVSWWKKAIEGTAMALAKVYNWMMSLVDRNWDSEAFASGLNEELQGGLEKIDIELEEKKKETESRRQQMRDQAGGDYETALEDIARERLKTGEYIEAAHQEEVEKIAEKLKEAKREWEEAVKQAKEVSKGEEIEPPKQAAFDAAQSARAQVRDMLEGATARGTFSSAALYGLGAGGVAQRIAEATAETARNTRKIAENTEEGAAFL
ncbi:MAG TPA: phage tail tape measure protein [Anaerohalosphaeraceae bacterium]|nr:phage tail tape measure protein [Anaerohalosphaeraceae bacterium]